MKNFLKSTAIFVCAALMMGACTKEDTEDIGGDYVPSPVVESLLPGNEKAVLTWYNPVTNENVSKCQISWVGPNDIKGATIQSVEKLGSTQSYSIMDENEAFVAGTYTVSITSIATTGDISETVTDDVTIYDSSSYETPEIVTTEATDGVVMLTWGDIHADCDSIRIAYYDEYGIVYYTLVDDFESETPLVTSLEGAAYETEISYNAYFIPEGGYDYVIKSETYTLGNIPDAPTSVVAKGGFNRFTVDWNITASGSDLAALDYALITYNKSLVVDDEESTDDEETTDEEETVYYTEKAYGLSQGANSYELSGIEAGDYDVTVQIFNKSGFSSNDDDVDADCNVVTVYSEESYSPAPIASLVNVNGDITINFNAEDVDEDCTALSVTYQKSESESDTATAKVNLTTDVSESGLYSVTISNGYGTSPITVTGTFCPSGEYTLGDVLVVDQLSEYTLPELAPAAPTSQTVTLDFNATASWVTVSWTLGDLTNVDAVRVYYTEEDYKEFSTTATSYTFSTADENPVIEVDSEYTIEVKTVTAAGMTSEAAESFIAKPYDYSSHTNNDFPTPTISTEMNESGEGVVVITWSDVHDDLKRIAVTYAGKEYTYEPNEEGEMMVTEDMIYVAGEMTYTFNAIFYPDGGLTENEVINTSEYSFTVADVTPAAPATIAVVTGLTDNGGSKVTVDWSIDDVTNVTDMYVFYYVDSTDDDDVDVVSLKYETSDAIEVGDYSMVIEGLATGTAASPTTYSIYVMTYNGGVDAYSDSSTVESEVAPYLQSGYFVAPTIESIDYADGIMTIGWGDTSYSSLTEVTVYYQTKDSSGAVTTASEVIKIYTGTIADLLITGAIPGTAVTYVATFLPTGAVDEVDVDSTASYYVPSAASDFVFQAGVEYVNSLYNPVIRVSWGLDDVSNASKITLYYKESTASTYTTKDITIKESGDSYEEVITVGYSGRVYEGYVGVLQSDGLTEYTTSVETITTYGTVDYLNVVTPTVDSSNNIWDGDMLTAMWTGYEGIADLYSIDVMNGDDILVTTMYADLVNGTTFDTSLLDNIATFTYHVNFIPEGGADIVAIVCSYSIAESAIPSDPSYLSDFITGYDEAGAYVKVFAEADETEDIFLYQTAFEFTEVGASFPSYVGYVGLSDYEAMKSEDGYKLYVSSDGLKIDTDYNVRIYNVTEAGTQSLGSVVIEDIIRLYNEASFTTNSTSIDMDVLGVNITPTWNNLYDDTVLSSLTYNDVVYEFELVDGVVCTVGTETEFSIPVENLVDDYSYSYVVNICPSAGETTTTITGAGTIVYSCAYNEEVYEIYTTTGLVYFAELVNGGNASIDGKLMNDLSLSTVCSADLGSWTPIGSSSAYTGTFDGNSKTIDAIYFNTSGLTYRGLFGTVTGATIKDIKLSNVDATFGGSVSPISGSLVGLANGASYISGCEVSSGTVNITSTAAGYSAGVIGRVGAGTTVENCINRATINSSIQQAGGVIASVNTSYAYIKGCINYGTMNVANYSGGIIGYLYQSGASYTSEITDCHNYGEINGSSTIVGGIAGSTRCASGGLNIENCTNSGKITTVGQYIGGITGYAIDASVTTITNCTNNGDITSDAGNVGGILGWENVATGTLTITECTNNGALQGTSNIGGIMGTSKATVSIVGPGYNYGAITATTSNGGGIIGNNAGTVTNYTNKGLVTVAGSPSNGTDVNGIYGTNSGTVTGCVDEY